jgi:hypothetical protein
VAALPPVRGRVDVSQTCGVEVLWRRSAKVEPKCVMRGGITGENGTNQRHATTRRSWGPLQRSCVLPYCGCTQVRVDRSRQSLARERSQGQRLSRHPWREIAVL